VKEGSNVIEPSFFMPEWNQPYSRLAFALFEPLTWPEGSLAPYDATAWQYNLMRDIEVDRIDAPDILNISAPLINNIALYGTLSGEISEGYYVIDHHSINNIVTLAFALAEKVTTYLLQRELIVG